MSSSYMYQIGQRLYHRVHGTWRNAWYVIKLAPHTFLKWTLGRRIVPHLA
jgi:hypothetical protein